MSDKNSGREGNKLMRDIQGSVKAEYEKEKKRKIRDREICTQKRNKVDNIIGRNNNIINRAIL